MEAITLTTSYGGLPLWGWIVIVGIGVVNEAIQRSKWTEAQTLWQAFWRTILWTPFGRIPVITVAIQYMAGSKKAESNPAASPTPPEPPKEAA